MRLAPSATCAWTHSASRSSSSTWSGPRRRDAGGDIDCSGELPDGTKLQGLGDLKRVLVADPAFVRTLTHKLFVYGVGRELRPVDRLQDLRVDELLATGKVTVRDLLLAVVRDVAFTSRLVAAAK